MAMRQIVCFTLLLLWTMLLPASVEAQTRTVGKIYYNDTLATLGYTLFTPNQSFKTYLIENCGLKVHEWSGSYQPGMMAYLREDGLLLRTGRDFSNSSFPSNGGNGGYLELLDWWSQQLWLYKVSDHLRLAHHDVWPMPNGNVLVLAWEKYDFNAAKNAGRDPSQIADGEIWGEVVYELKPVFPDSAIVAWEWHVWDHLVQDFDSTQGNYGNVADHPELLDINYLGISQGNADWLHANSVAYNPQRDEVVVSFREINEVMVIDHSTTTTQAAGHTGGNHGKGGDILYRWGNPQAYRRGTVADQTLFEQHDAHWVEDTLPHGGELIIFSNGLSRGYSSVEFVTPPTDSLGHYVIGGGAFLPDSAQTTFRPLPGETIDSGIMAGAHILPNGNLLVTQAVRGRFLEFDPNRERVWEYISPALPLSTFVAQGQPVPPNGTIWANSVFKARKYMPTYPGLEGKPLPHGDPLEMFPYPDTTCSTPVGAAAALLSDFHVFPNPAHDLLFIRSGTPLRKEWRLMDGCGRVCLAGRLTGTETTVALDRLSTGMYILEVGGTARRKVLVRQ